MIFLGKVKNVSNCKDMLCLDHFELVIDKLSLSFVTSCRLGNLYQFVR